MSGRKQKFVENKRKQRTVVAAHKRNVRAHQIGVRDEVKPQLRETKQKWFRNTRGHKLRIRREWGTRMQEVHGHMKEQQRAHRQKIIAHKIKVRAMMNQ